MQGISAKLDWNRMLGFEQVASERAAVRKTGRLGAKVGGKPGIKPAPGSIRIGAKVGIKPGPSNITN